jgi:hypothetical protein
MEAASEEDVVCSRGDVALLRRVVKNTVVLGLIKGSLGPVGPFDVVGFRTATPSENANVLGALGQRPGYAELLLRVLVGAKPYVKKRVWVETPFGREARDDHYSILMNVSKCAALTAHDLIELQPEEQLRRDLAVLEVAPEMTERYLSGI